MINNLFFPCFFPFRKARQGVSLRAPHCPWTPPSSFLWFLSRDTSRSLNNDCSNKLTRQVGNRPQIKAKVCSRSVQIGLLRQGQIEKLNLPDSKDQLVSKCNTRFARRRGFTAPEGRRKEKERKEIICPPRPYPDPIQPPPPCPC